MYKTFYTFELKKKKSIYGFNTKWRLRELSQSIVTKISHKRYIDIFFSFQNNYKHILIHIVTW